MGKLEYRRVELDINTDQFTQHKMASMYNISRLVKMAIIRYELPLPETRILTTLLRG